MKGFVKVMKAFSDSNRVKIIKLLQRKPMCVCELQAALGISQSSVSKHLKILEEAGVVGFRKEGLWVNYFLTDGQRSPYAATLLGNMRHWLDQDPEVADVAKRLPGIRREEICKGERAGESRSCSVRKGALP
jgi:ArsR family transcriptional regulator